MTSESPRVSILTPTYNHARFIQECIQSVLDQSVSEWELIIIDDGSPDKTVEIAKSFLDSRIRVVELPNRGIKALADTYNHGLELAQAPVIAILEGDDFWPADKLEIQLPDFDDPQVVLSSGLFVACKENGDLVSLHPQNIPPNSSLRNEPVGSACLEMMNPQFLTFTYPVSTIIRKSALKAIGGFHQPSFLPLVDFPTFLRIGLQGNWRFHNRILGFWRRHGGSVTKSNYPTILDGVYRLNKDFIEDHSSQIPADTNMWRYLDTLWLNKQIERSIVLHRYLMDKHEFRRASEIALHASRYPAGKKTKCLLRVASILSRCGISTEVLFRFALRGDWKKEFETISGDRSVDVDGGPELLPYRHLAPKESR